MWKYKIGTVVRESNMLGTLDYDRKALMKFGHVIGFAQNTFETILWVRWEDGSEQEIHPTNVLTEEDVK